MIDIVHVILLLMHLLVLSKVLLLLIHRLSDNSLCVEVHCQVLEPFDFKLENFGTVKIFIVYSEFLLNFKLCQLRASQLQLINGVFQIFGLIKVLFIDCFNLCFTKHPYLLLHTLIQLVFIDTSNLEVPRHQLCGVGYVRDTTSTDVSLHSDSLLHGRHLVVAYVGAGAG